MSTRRPSAKVLAALEHHQAGRLPQAHRGYTEALREDPDDFHAHHFMGVLMHQGGHHQQARAHLEQALAQNDQMPDPWVNLAPVLRALDEPEAAIQALEKALALEPGLQAAWGNLGNLRQDLRDYPGALAAYEKSLALDPGDADSHYNLATVLARMGRTAESIDACKASIALQPGRGDVYGLLADHLLSRNENREAIDCISQGLERDPRHPGLLYTLGFAQSSLGQLVEARDAWQAALEVDPNHGPALSGLMYTRRRLAEWDGQERLVQRFVSGVDAGTEGLTPFAFLAEDSDRTQQLRCARLWTQQVLADLAAIPDPPGLKRRKGKLTIGYLSADYWSHPTAFLAAGLFEQHDREQFRIIGYSNGRDDQSDIRERVIQAFDEFVDIREMPATEAARRIRADAVDILVDLKGHTLEAATAVMALRPAVIQVQYLGYPGSMGAAFIDYLVGDAEVTPFEHADDYDEHIVQLPGSYQVNDSERPHPSARQTREELGLPQEGTVFCCFNAAWKFGPRQFGLWMDILTGVPGSVLWLLSSGPEDSLISNLRQEAQKRGVDPQRLVFARTRPMKEYLALYHHADLFLDTLPYNAHTTASDALWMGCPVLTLRGDTFAARVGASLLSAVDLPRLITDDPGAFRDLAISLGRDRNALAELREHLLAGRDSFALFDTARFTRQLEAAWLEMARRHEKGEAGAFAVPQQN